jgi:peroxiredoxin
MKNNRQSVKKLLPVLGLLVVIFATACSSNQLSSDNQDYSSGSPLAAEVAYAAAAVPESQPQEVPIENQVTAPPAQAEPQPVQEINPAQEPAVEAAAPAEKAAAPAVDQSTDNQAPAAAAPAAAQMESKPQIGFIAPDFSLQTLDGQVVQLSALRGKPVVISYWATWCVPCKQELPVLERLSQEYQAQGIQFLLINAIEQDGLDKVMEYVTQAGFSLPILLDEGNQFHNAYEQLFFPTSYYIDTNGVIQDIKLGDATEADIREKINKLLSTGL